MVSIEQRVSGQQHRHLPVFALYDGDIGLVGQLIKQQVATIPKVAIVASIKTSLGQRIIDVAQLIEYIVDRFYFADDPLIELFSSLMELVVVLV